MSQSQPPKPPNAPVQTGYTPAGYTPPSVPYRVYANPAAYRIATEAVNANSKYSPTATVPRPLTTTSASIPTTASSSTLLTLPMSASSTSTLSQMGIRPTYTPMTIPGTSTPLSLPNYANYLQNAYPGMAAYPGFSALRTPMAPITPGVRVKGDEDEEDLPGMDDADYSAQMQFQSQSKADLKVLLDHFTPEQHARFEAYRRSALNKNGVRKVIQTVTGQQVSQPVAQVVAGIAKIFVGEIVEKARAIQERQGDTGSLTPDHLRAAYAQYQEEYGMIGPAKPLKGKKLFVR